MNIFSQLPKSQPKCRPSLAYIQAYIIDAHKLNLVCIAGQLKGSWLVPRRSNWLSSTSVELRISKESAVITLSRSLQFG